MDPVHVALQRQLIATQPKLVGLGRVAGRHIFFHYPFEEAFRQR